MKKIFVLWEDWATEDECVHSVWSTRKKAEDMRRKMINKLNCDLDKFRAEVFDVDADIIDVRS